MTKVTYHLKGIGTLTEYLDASGEMVDMDREEEPVALSAREYMPDEDSYVEWFLCALHEHGEKTVQTITRDQAEDEID